MRTEATESRGPKAPIRCAIYTRKSTDEGLDQDFNSLDAQREAAEAFVTSQKHEGWVCLPQRYDDGGFSGGNMARPGLIRLLEEVAAGGVDTILVYKVDRLSRSLLDFSRLMESFQKHRVSFVSITQQFNTTSSMGRLTLNILLSFAQFEREIIAERTRDKMSAARRKGKWVGGYPILGYDIDFQGRRLVVNEEEAPQVREIFSLYLRTGSLLDTAEQLNQRGWTTKRWLSGRGLSHGGKTFDKVVLSRFLSNATYMGKVRYRGKIYHGEHKAIIDRSTWGQVQRLLLQNGHPGQRTVRNEHRDLLGGLLRCASCGVSMVPVNAAGGSGKQYRYYVCSHAQRNGRSHCPSPSLPAKEIERFVLQQIRELADKPEIFREMVRQAGESGDGRNGDGETLDLREWEPRAALSLFGPEFDQLEPRARRRHLGLLLERVDYHGADGKLSLSFSPEGIRALVQEAAERSRGREDR